MEHQLFEIIPLLRIMICRQCQYGVWPAEVECHLKQQHQLPHSLVQPIVQAIQQWTEVAPNPQAIQVPQALDTPLPVLPCYWDGFLCRREPQACSFIASTLRSMRTHWYRHHQWSQYPGRGRVSVALRAQREAEFQQSFEQVAYQQLFPSRAGSHYIHIRYPQGRQSPPPPSDQAQRAVDAVLQAWEAAEAARQATPIEPDELTDANPWLRRTRWPEALQGIPAADLRQSVVAPDPEPQDAVEQGVQVLWETIAQVVRRSQQTVRYCGAAIRMEAVRNQAGRLPYQPLMAYLDGDDIQKHIQPWQQVLAFIARTQHPQDWAYPQYDLTARQRAKWEDLWWLIQHPEAPVEVEEALQPWIMRPREQACLEFCVELLNQRHRTQEYESALVCAMAVLGRGERGWQGPDSYPPILSRVIKIARFMVVQKALWLDPMVISIIRMWQKEQTEAPWALLSADQELEDIDEGYSSSRASSPVSRPLGLREFLAREASTSIIPPQRWARADMQARQQTIQTHLTVEAIIQEAPQWQDHCYICTMQGRHGASHDLYQCWEPESQPAKQWMMRVRRQIQYQAFSACYQCGMPQAEQVEEQAEEQGEEQTEEQGKEQAEGQAEEQAEEHADEQVEEQTKEQAKKEGKK
ncbi:hypothetical protein FE257_006692 [Aspergillus nanangensis]|uniref:Uncharacterized protein n=1 Tax=Aspergillus nanangensis TaxID=2582783 RepID=A0AAD4CQR0_ASPNN|nr:hypothetical protein FE257_006692 [Aspergillus nanangensis]